jgi:hypothetical protein
MTAPQGDEPLLLSGSIWVFELFNVAEEIQLVPLRQSQAGAASGREPKFRHPAPEYVRFESPPAIEPQADAALASGERCGVRVKYFDYGIISVELEIPFHCGWDELIHQVHRLGEEPELEVLATRIARASAARCSASLVKPYEDWLNEDYLVVQLADAGATPLSATDLVSRYGGRLCQLVRTEDQPLSQSEVREILGASVSYYPSDLLIVGWTAAVVYDSPEAANPTIQLLEYANTQLLEFRHYDGVLQRLSGELYKTLEKRGPIRRWRRAKEAARLNTLRLDVQELAERSENAIRFLSDMFYARVYRLAAERIGVNDYRTLVGEKLRIADELYRFIVDEFHQGRAFVLELAVVVILIIDLYYLLREHGLTIGVWR